MGQKIQEVKKEAIDRANLYGGWWSVVRVGNGFRCVAGRPERYRDDEHELKLWFNTPERNAIEPEAIIESPFKKNTGATLEEALKSSIRTMGNTVHGALSERDEENPVGRNIFGCIASFNWGNSVTIRPTNNWIWSVQFPAVKRSFVVNKVTDVIVRETTKKLYKTK